MRSAPMPPVLVYSYGTTWRPMKLSYFYDVTYCAKKVAQILPVHSKTQASN